MWTRMQTDGDGRKGALSHQTKRTLDREKPWHLETSQNTQSRKSEWSLWQVYTSNHKSWKNSTLKFNNDQGTDLFLGTSELIHKITFRKLFIHLLFESLLHFKMHPIGGRRARMLLLLYAAVETAVVAPHPNFWMRDNNSFKVFVSQLVDQVVMLN